VIVDDEYFHDRHASLCSPLSLSGSVTSRANETLVLERVMESVREMYSRTNNVRAPVPRCHRAILQRGGHARLSEDATFFERVSGATVACADVGTAARPERHVRERVRA
jgi:hypothetical protein